MRSLTPLLALALAPSLALAQTPQLSQTGGSTTGVTVWSVSAAPLQAYGVVLSTNETTSEILPGVFLAIDLVNLPLTFSLPGFFGLTGLTGQASAAISFSDPSLVGLQISAQALTGPFFDDPSNLVRVTLGNSGEFTTTIGGPTLAIDGGAVVSDANGDLVFAGGSGSQAQRYDVDLEEFSSAGTTFSVGVTSQSVVLNDGRILFTGGFDVAGHPTDSAAVYDPTTSSITTLTMGSKRVAHRATKLADGRVWITGGIANVSETITDILADPIKGIAAFNGILKSTEFFDPLTDSFSAGPDLPVGRALHSATLLANGKVFLMGGMATGPSLLLPAMSDTSVIYTPTLGTFGSPTTYTGPRLLHTAILQTDGSVLIAGGLELHGLIDFILTGDIFKLTIGSLDTVDRFVPALFGGGTFTNVGTLNESRGAASLIETPGGNLLIVGGMNIAFGPLVLVTPTVSAAADLYAQGSGTTALPAMANSRYEPILVNAPDGTTLIVGGSFQLTSGLNIDAEVYQP